MIYLLRHGTPEGGKRRYIGVTDLPLSERGRREARLRGAWLRDNAAGPMRVYASPLRRAWETASLAFPDSRRGDL